MDDLCDVTLIQARGRFCRSMRCFGICSGFKRMAGGGFGRCSWGKLVCAEEGISCEVATKNSRIFFIKRFFCILEQFVVSDEFGGWVVVENQVQWWGGR